MRFFIALKFLTIFPAPAVPDDSPENIGHSLPYFPVIGAIIGILLVALYYLVHLVFPTALVSALLVAFLAVITGAHHIDGLMDTCDAFAAGKTREERLAIMSDTRTGAFGVTGAILLVLTKFAALTAISQTPPLLIFPVISRWAMPGVMLIFPPAKDSGLGHAAREGANLSAFLVATTFTLIISILTLGLIAGPVLMALSFLLVICLGYAFKRLFGGLTGDSYGALVEVGEVLTLLLIILLSDFGILSASYNLIKLPFGS